MAKGDAPGASSMGNAYGGFFRQRNPMQPMNQGFGSNNQPFPGNQMQPQVNPQMSGSMGSIVPSFDQNRSIGQMTGGNTGTFYHAPGSATIQPDNGMIQPANPMNSVDPSNDILQKLLQGGGQFSGGNMPRTL